MKKSIAIIGGGPASMLCAAFLDTEKYDVTIYEKGKVLGRKFLVAGKGGFNLTHSENTDSFVDRYTPNDFLRASILDFDNNDLRVWLEQIGIPTFVGSSGRVYPEKNIKPIEVLSAILKTLKQNKVAIQYKKEWKGWTEGNELLFTNDYQVKADYVIFGLGGGTWKVTGSAGDWLNTFEDKGIDVIPFYPSNCTYAIDWKADYIDRHAGKPLKNIAVTCDSKTQKGEVVITEFGLEGNAIYALSPEIRKQLQIEGKASISIDFKPSLSEEQVLKKLSQSKFQKITDCLKNDLKLSKSVIDLLKLELNKESFLDLLVLAENIKSFGLNIKGISSLDEAISSVGGVSILELDNSFQLNKLHNQFCIGEMIDWDAPTGGYLLQACFSMGVKLARQLNQRE